MSERSLLIVDEEESVLSSMTRLLCKEQLNIVTTRSPFEALHLANQQKFAVIISAFRLPYMSGTELLEKFQEVSPETVRLMLTGCADHQVAIDAVNRGHVYQFLYKSWEDPVLLEKIRQAVDFYDEQFDQAGERTLMMREMYQDLVKKTVNRSQEILKLNQELEQCHVRFVESMLTLLQMTQPQTYHHARRVASLSLKIGRQFKLSQKELFQLEVAALLHDIGSLGLADDQFEEPTQMHAGNGAAILAQLEKFQEASLMVRHHHERFDGKGFPDGLIGVQIPVGSRIIAVAETMDQLMRRKKASQPISIKLALSYLDAESGQAFDPAIIQALKDLVDASGQTQDQEIDYDNHLVSPYETAWIWEEAEGVELPVLRPEPEKVPVAADLPVLRPEPEKVPVAADLPVLRSEPEKAPAAGSLPFIRPELEKAPVAANLPFIRSEPEKAPVAARKVLEEPSEKADDRLTELEQVAQEIPLWEPLSWLPEKVPDKLPEKEKVNQAAHAAAMAYGQPLPMVYGQPSPMPVSSVAENLSEPEFWFSEGPQLAYIAERRSPIRNTPAVTSYPVRRRRKHREMLISPEQLQIGMVISRNLISQKGRMLLKGGTTITPDKYEQLCKFLDNDPPVDGIYIYLAS